MTNASEYEHRTMNVSLLLPSRLGACTGPRIFDPTASGVLASMLDDFAHIFYIYIYREREDDTAHIKSVVIIECWYASYLLPASTHWFL